MIESQGATDQRIPIVTLARQIHNRLTTAQTRHFQGQCVRPGRAISPRCISDREDVVFVTCFLCDVEDLIESAFGRGQFEDEDRLSCGVVEGTPKGIVELGTAGWRCRRPSLRLSVVDQQNERVGGTRLSITGGDLADQLENPTVNEVLARYLTHVADRCVHTVFHSDAQIGTIDGQASGQAIRTVRQAKHHVGTGHAGILANHPDAFKGAFRVSHHISTKRPDRGIEEDVLCREASVARGVENLLCRLVIDRGVSNVGETCRPVVSGLFQQHSHHGKGQTRSQLQRFEPIDGDRVDEGHSATASATSFAVNLESVLQNRRVGGIDARRHAVPILRDQMEDMGEHLTRTVVANPLHREEVINVDVEKIRACLNLIGHQFAQVFVSRMTVDVVACQPALR